MATAHVQKNLKDSKKALAKTEMGYAENPEYRETKKSLQRTKDAYAPSPKYRGRKKSLKALEEKLMYAVEERPEWAFIYAQETLNIEMAEMLYRLRTQSGLSQKEVAEQAGLTQPFVARLENPNSVKQPTLDTLAKIARAFNKRVKISFTDIKTNQAKGAI
jgi:DNA-binding XRE family transcriptional regulator